MPCLKGEGPDLVYLRDLCCTETLSGPGFALSVLLSGAC